ncbi:cytochrome b561 [Bradyrhizobium sp. SSBR45G]|uniref:cytochrome b n=1 Tax=unclassified Bradyrhizobium TaxID=2631580 RepID=UPI0023428D1A|nr:MULTISPECIES: cytochrome b [unclassified Bradyrhizobium]GLH79592.1 cytochrome b561 [Bradyrhizobium sp. SSBR45G]GLH87013.1 cytochrome b561 [Bradyrhizobium sp. SSBR45R]
MRIRNSAKTYGSVAIGLHWIVAVLVPAAWISGHLGEELSHSSEEMALFAHVSLGLAMLGFALARLGWRLADPPPVPEPTRLGAWTVRAGEIAHLLIYGIMFAIPALGILTQFASGEALPVFGLFEIASPWSGDRGLAHDMKEMHEALANGLMILIGLHVAAALLHHYWLHDRTLKRMMPGLR